MQRQSLGSPGRGELVVEAKNDAVSTTDERKRRESSPISFSGVDDEEIKPEKPFRRCHSQPEKFIHLIPIFIFLCFFTLYLSSHDPSPKELALFPGFSHPEKIIDSTDIDDIGRFDDNKLKRSGVFAIRSLRNLQEEGNQKSRSHRKLGDF
ncbi:uncharacterized protein LOC130800957 [Amaranthus tricolor]|uniref:uncharacterized protein LOC130800957 n=1 Tax=Amaranthus tricolor TaxID=29722 RepID=UPI0025877984|nr:uncharacterized protein LOC130800957 [Amaranthus tricolor]